MARAIVRSAAKMSDKSNPPKASAFHQAKMKFAARLADAAPRDVEQPFACRAWRHPWSCSFWLHDGSTGSARSTGPGADW
ncbi:hypothetical protein [Bradyrhizobium sp. 142]|uniref:hypothetical protein n=1 Tax=Bradyrhizobium sp. 142 TaxID=2782618 RepID=UPI001FF84E58|nr:hypothetical protein [Bradyrhizobium sp. 142]MCK1724981.1 hypothetical protein [Bradyrhizobium sp. 142]